MGKGERLVYAFSKKKKKLPQKDLHIFIKTLMEGVRRESRCCTFVEKGKQNGVRTPTKGHQNSGETLL